MTRASTSGSSIPGPASELDFPDSEIPDEQGTGDPVGRSPFVVTGLPLDPSIQLGMLDTVLDSACNVGALSVFRRNHRKIVSDQLCTSSFHKQVEFDFLTSRSVIPALFMYSRLFHPTPSVPLPETFAEDCRMHALSNLPTLTWKAGPTAPGDIYCLCLLSTLGYLDHDITEVAGRWAVLSENLAASGVPSSLSTPSTPELWRRILSLVDINTEVHSILFNRYLYGDCWKNVTIMTDPSANYGSERPTVSDAEWNQQWDQPDAQGYTRRQVPSAEESFFNLFSPLRRIMKAAQFYTLLESHIQDSVSDALEEYFLTFPTGIMELEKVELVWQLEAMIWFHGIYLYTTSGPDFLNILLSPDIVKSSAFPRTAEHSILIGDIIPYLIRMENALVYIFHLTIYFVALSAAVHIAMIRSLHNSDSSAPPLLVRSARAHEKALQLIVSKNPACTHPIIKGISRILSLVLHSVSHGAQIEVEDLIPSIQQVKCYRWMPEGRGLLSMNEELAENLLQGLLTRHRPGDLSIGSLSEIQHILRPASRITQAGTFDLSILNI